MKRQFNYNGRTYDSMTAIAKELGKTRIYPKDFDKYGIVEILDKNEEEGTIMVNEEVTESVDSEEITEEEVIIEVNTSEDSQEGKEAPEEELEQAEEEPEEEDVQVDEDIAEDGNSAKSKAEEIVEKVPDLTVVQFNDIVSHWTVEELVELAETAKVNTWENIENRPIRKMRLLMEIKKYYYPNDKTPVKPASIWKKVPLEDLIELANKFNLEFREVENPQIQRMWVIKALADAGITYEDYKPVEVKETESETETIDTEVDQEETC